MILRKLFLNGLPQVAGNKRRVLSGIPVTTSARIFVYAAVERIPQSQDRELELAVVNSGPGIAAEDLPRIFEPFYRGRNAVPGGSGIGLSIVKEVSRIHGAKVSVQSGEGKGVTIAVRFPRQKLKISP